MAVLVGRGPDGCADAERAMQSDAELVLRLLRRRVLISRSHHAADALLRGSVVQSVEAGGHHDNRHVGRFRWQKSLLWEFNMRSDVRRDNPCQRKTATRFMS